jgi:EAL domain-containing protein (putative c-di-GMP-specific phosphodiesterase class I)
MTSLPSHALALLQEALETGSLSLAYQPQVELATGRIVGWEALSRWHHPEHGTIAPDAFIPLAEQHGLIVPLGQWLWHQATQDLHTLLRSYPHTRLAINVSMLELSHTDFFQRLNHLLNTLPPAHLQHLEVELTETAYLGCTQQLIAPLQALQQRGITLAIDDFGTGHSSLERLHALPFNKIKLDKSFIQQLASQQDEWFVQETIALAARLGTELVCEGIETAQQASQLQQLGVQFGQGFYFGKPMPLAHWITPQHP